MSKQSPEKPERDLDEWDAEIEAEFQCVTGQTKAAGRQTRNRRHVGFPLAFLADVCRLTKGRAALVAAVCLYRRSRVRGSRTVTLPLEELDELGFDRKLKHRALAQLRRAGLIEVEITTGRTTQITLLWQPG